MNQPMSSSPSNDQNDYLPVYLDALRIDTVLDFDLFLNRQGQMVLYRHQNLPFTDRTRKGLLEHRVDRLYVPNTSRKNYQRYIESSLDQIIADDSVPEPSKAKIIYETSKNLVEDVFANPRLGGNIQRSKKMVEHTTSYILRGHEAFVHMLQISSFDYYTYTHSINCCTFTIALAQRLDVKNPSILHELGVGALLHDLGKSKVHARILRKRGPLSRTEYELMKKHPVWGAEILRETNLVPPKAYYPVLQHHERMDGSGYPYGLRDSQIHLYGKIAAIADSFDALTTRRAYKDALDSFKALKIMRSKAGLFDQGLLNEFIKLMGPAETKDDALRTANKTAEFIV